VKGWHGVGDMVARTQPGQCSTRSVALTDAWEDTTDTPGMQQWHKGPRPETAAMKQEGI
jgi:hypothetical protein